jgi:hypothetical protein
MISLPALESETFRRPANIEIPIFKSLAKIPQSTIESPKWFMAKGSGFRVKVPQSTIESPFP